MPQRQFKQMEFLEDNQSFEQPLFTSRKPLIGVREHTSTVQTYEAPSTSLQQGDSATEERYSSNWNASRALQDKLNYVVEQRTETLPALKESDTTFLQRALNKLPSPVKRALIMILDRSQDPELEISYDSHLKAESTPTLVWGWLPILTLTSTIGMLSLAEAYTRARYGAPGGEIFFWTGLLLIYVPIVVRLISPRASRFERISLLCIAGFCFYMVDVVGRPFSFADYDAFVHWRTAQDIAMSGNLFSENSLIPASPFYPGLEIVTNAFSTISGLSIFEAGIIVVGVARLVMILSLFMLYEQITRSARIAGIAMSLYMSNPHFLFFDALFSYETLALPLAIFVIFAIARHQTLSTRLAQLESKFPSMIFTKLQLKELKSELRWLTITAWLVMGAVTITHHMTDFVLDGFLMLWALVCIIQNPASLLRSNLTRTALLGVIISLAWINLKGNPVVGYLSSYFDVAFKELGQVLSGTGQARQLFASYTGQPEPLWERIIALASIILIVFCLPFGLLCFWRRHCSNALAWALGIATFLYPISQLFRLTNAGSEITDRAAAFLFIPIGCVLAVFIAQFWPTRRLNWKQTSLIGCALTVIYLGGVILGAGPPWALLPGPYLVAADVRSIEPEGIQAATWANLNLGPNHRIATDRTNQLLMSTYGAQHVVTGPADNIEVAPIFTSSRLGPSEVAILRSASVQYLVVDLRLSAALPTLGFYFDGEEPGAYQYSTPISLKALTKFNSSPQINREFDSGDIVIYDVGGIISASETP